MVRNFNKYTSALLPVICLAMISVVYAADQDFFDVYSLEVEGAIYGFSTGDLNGDNLQDVAVIYSAVGEPETRYLGLYVHNPGNSFNTRSDYLVKLHKGAAQINTGDINGDGRDEILIIYGDGIYAISFIEGGGLSDPVRIINTETIFAFPYFRGIIAKSFLYEINDSPGRELLIPTRDGYLIYERGENGAYQVLNQLSVPISGHNVGKGLSEFSSHQGFKLSIDLPEIYALDGNLDGRQDLYFLWDRQVCTFFQDETENFASEPSVTINIFTTNASGFYQSQLADFNGDMRPDVAVSFTTGGITNTETKIRFHLANSVGIIESYFRKELTLSDSHCNMIINDVNNDGAADLIVPAIELGALSVTQMFLMKKSDIHLLIYPFEAGLPDEEPSKRLKYDFKFNFDDYLPTGEVTLDWSADYNGDQILDLAFVDGRGKVSFYWGDKNDYLSKRSNLGVSLEHPARVYPLHLDNDDDFDLIVEHRLNGRYDRLTILKNKSSNK